MSVPTSPRVRDLVEQLQQQSPDDFVEIAMENVFEAFVDDPKAVRRSKPGVVEIVVHLPEDDERDCFKCHQRAEAKKKRDAAKKARANAARHVLKKPRKRKR